MDRETRMEETGCGMPTFERNRYFYGKPMTVRDFEAEQHYLIGKSRFTNRQLHGAGVICGLQVALPLKFDADEPSVNITEGAALDCCGNLIVVGESGKAEIKGRMSEGLNYLYIEFAECTRQPILASANVSSCEEVCCYNRIRETFQISASADPPYESTLAGNVSIDTKTKLNPVAGARVEVLKDGIVKARTTTDAKGNYSVNLPRAGTYDVRATGKDFKASSMRQTLQKRQLLKLDFRLEASAPSSPPAPPVPPPTNADALCRTFTERYFDERLRACPDECDAPKVFLAVVEVRDGAATLKTDETNRYRPVVYSNPMLHELMCDHLGLSLEHFNDFNNPHRTNAQQVGALRSVNLVGNTGGAQGYVGNISIESDDTIKIENQAAQNRILLKTIPAQTVTGVGATKTVGIMNSFAREDHVHDFAERAVKRTHLAADVFENLLAADDTIKIEGQPAQNRILLKTVPAKTVTGVGATKAVGVLNNFAREDHVHDLAEAVVKRAHLSSELFENLLAADDAGITITPEAALRRVRLQVNAGTDATLVRSVAAEKSAGTSARFAREDHAHNLRINDIVPDADGKLQLSAGSNITVTKRASNELVFAAANATRCASGIVTFPNMNEQEDRTSTPIPHGFGAASVAILVAFQNPDGPVIRVGDRNVFFNDEPAIMATYTPNASDFRIRIKDRRPFASPPRPRNFTVRWWAIVVTETETQKIETVSNTTTVGGTSGGTAQI